jgi:hypothetical protein
MKNTLTPLFSVRGHCVIGDLLHLEEQCAFFFGANTNAIAVAFVDVNLFAAAQASIVSDLQLCLQNWGDKAVNYISRNTSDLSDTLTTLTGILVIQETSHYPRMLFQWDRWLGAA